MFATSYSHLLPLGSPKVTRARIKITVPDDVWIGDLSRQFSETTFQIQSARSSGGVGVVLAELQGPTVEGVIAGLADERAVTDYEVFHREDRRALLQLEATNPFLLFPVEASAAPLQMPFEIVDGTVTWELITTRDRLSNLGEQLDVFGISYEVERIQPQIGFERILTDKQSRVVEAALEEGYYDSPRTCTLTELAEQLDMAASTCSETLHRAEERIIKRFDGEHAGQRSRMEASSPSST